MVSLQFILDTMIKFNKSLSKIFSDLEESSPILKNSLLEISPVNFCINIKNHQNIYIVIDRDNSKKGNEGFIILKRRDDYWAKDEPRNIGIYNFVYKVMIL